MKIAFVNQPCDVIVPPFQSSIGCCTYGVARSLASSSEVLVYGLRDPHPKGALELCDPSLRLQLIKSELMERSVWNARRMIGEMVKISTPMSTSNWLFPQYGQRVAEDLQRQQCDIIHIQHCSQYVPIIRALNPKSKIVLHMHAEWFSQSNFQVLQQRLECVDWLFTVSDYITHKTVRDFPVIAARCQTTPCGIDSEEFVREKDYAAGRQRKERRILFAGAVSPHKGPHVLLDAFKIVAKQYPDARLEFVGSLRNYPMEETFDLSDRTKLQHVAPFYAKKPVARLRAKFGLASADAGTYQSYLKSKLTPELSDKVTFTGFIHRQDFVDRYYDADIFVFPPIWDEGFGIPPIEAMAAGLPVVGTLSGALPETVREGVTGFLVEKGDHVALAERILRLLRDDYLRESMGRAARRHVLATYTWERAADSLESRYRWLLNKQPKQIDRKVPVQLHTSVEIREEAKVNQY
jgi:glycosyltransferase involved in cell wall biosynthesis